MKMRWMGILLTAIVILCMPVTAQAVEWTKLWSGSSTNSGIQIIQNGNVTEIVGNESKPELEDVLLSNWAGNAITINDEKKLFDSGKYVFKNVTLTGDFHVISVEAKGKGFEIVLDETVDGRTTGIILDAGISQGKPSNRVVEYRGRICAEIDCSTKGISASAINNSKITLFNYGDTVYITVDADQNSSLEMENHGDILGNDERYSSVLAQTYTNSTMVVSNYSEHTQTVYAWAGNNSKLTMLNQGSADLVSLESLNHSNVEFTCNGKITNQIVDDGNEWGNCAVMIEIDENSKLTMLGSGEIEPGRQLWDYYLGEENGKFEDGGIPGASVICDVEHITSEDQSYADQVDIVRRSAKNITLDWNRIEKSGEVPHPVLAVRRDERAFIYPLYPDDIHFPALKDKNDIHGERTAEPQILIGGEPDDKTDLYLKVEDYTIGSGSVRYELKLVDARDGKQDVLKHSANGKNASIYLPYPDGMSGEEAQRTEFVIRHDTGNGIEVYSTADGTAQRIESGLLVEVKSLSPFEMIWDVSVPGTGDESRIVWSMTALLVSVMLLGMMRKKRQHA